MTDPYASRREAAARIQERRERRMHRLFYLSQAVGPATGRLFSVLANLAPGPAGTILRGILGAYAALEKREETRELKAEIAALKKAVAELEGLANEDGVP